MARVLVLGVAPYSFIQEETGEKVEGSTLHFIDFTDDQEKNTGYAPMKMPIKPEMEKKIIVAPAYYDFDYAVTIGAGSKPKVTLKEIKLFKELKLEVI